MTTSQVVLRELVQRTEQRLAHFYNFLPQASAADHLLTGAEFSDHLEPQEALLPELGGRAAVLLSRELDCDLFIGIYFAEDVVRLLAEHNPFTRLSSANLDAFCLLVEEVSHFHLLLNRAAAGLEVSKLELECQGEIDKLLIAALVLEEQCGDLHVLPLARKLYDCAQIVSNDYELYWQATRHAARFWFDQLQHRGAFDERLRRLLQQSYRRPLAGKLEAFAAVRQHAS